jgi:hypothetical protein
MANQGQAVVSAKKPDVQSKKVPVERCLKQWNCDAQSGPDPCGPFLSCFKGTDKGTRKTDD